MTHDEARAWLARQMRRRLAQRGLQDLVVDLGVDLIQGLAEARRGNAEIAAALAAITSTALVVVADGMGSAAAKRAFRGAYLDVLAGLVAANDPDGRRVVN